MKLSVIVPVYDVEKYIDKCLSSLHIQDYKELEFIVVNDGTLDNSQAIIDTYVEKDSRFKSYIKENGGWGTAIKYGIDRATGDYITVLDSDDWFMNSDSISKYMSRISETNTDILIGGYYVYTMKKDEMRKAHHVPNKIFNSDYEKIFNMYVSPHAKFFKRSLVENLEFISKVNYCDVLLFFGAILNSNTLIFDDSICEVVYWEDRFGNSMSVVTNRKTNHVYKVYSKLLQMVSSHEKNSNINYSRLYDHIAYKVKETSVEDRRIKQLDEFVEENKMLYKELSRTIKEHGGKVEYKYIHASNKIKRILKFLYYRFIA